MRGMHRWGDWTLFVPISVAIACLSILALAQQHFKQSPNFMTEGAVASALACKYAKTGDSSYREQAEGMLAQAANDAKTEPNAQKIYDEYAERIQYRLKSREIIDTDEYNRRFRSGQTAKQ